MLLNRDFFPGSLVVLLVFHIVAAPELPARKMFRNPVQLNLPCTFCLLNCAAAVAFVRIISSRND